MKTLTNIVTHVWRGRLLLAVVLAVALALSAAATALPGASAARRTLIVAVLGHGRVTSRPAGIACPGRCAAHFAVGTRVLLTPTAKAGFRFRRWGGACAGSGTCRLTLRSSKAATATFVPGPKPPQVAAVAGSYAGSNGQNGNGLSFYVAPGGRSLLNISDPAAGLVCTPATAGGATDHFGILQATIGLDGTFSAKSTQVGISSRFGPAHWSYSFVGRFRPASAASPASAAGTWREDIVADSGVKCTTNDQSFTATRDNVPLQPKLPPVAPGSYQGSNGQNGNGMSFSVSSDGKSILNVADPAVGLICTPATAGGATDHLAILTIPIHLDNSFSAQTSQDGVFRRANAKFTYSFNGFYEGTTRLGGATVAGTMREDIVTTSGPAISCSSNDLFWYANRTG